MRKTILLTVLIMFGSLVLFSFAKASKNNVQTVSVVKADSSVTEISLSQTLYNELHLDSVGLSQQVVEYAVKGYEKLLNEGVVNNSQYLTIVDFSQTSR